MSESSAAALDEVLAAGLADDLERLRSEVHLRASLTHPAVARRAARAAELLAGTRGLTTALVVHSYWRAFSSMTAEGEVPFGRAEDEGWLARFGHLVGLAACSASAAACGGAPPPRWAAGVLGLAQLLWGNVWALPEHSAWGLSYWDVRVLAAGSFCPLSRFVAEDLLAAGRGGGPGAAIQPALRAASWYPAPHACSLMGLAAAPPRAPGLRVVVVQAHHGLFQETQSLLHAVSLDHWGRPAEIVPYLLKRGWKNRQWSGIATDGLSWGSGSGPPESRGDPDKRRLFSLREGLEMVRGWVASDADWRAADAVVDCNPAWVCVALHHVAPELPIVMRNNMALLLQYFDWEELDTFWAWLADLTSSARCRFSVGTRLVGEQIFWQTGVRPEYVPMVMIHLSGVAHFLKNESSTDEVLLFKNTHPGFDRFVLLLKQHAGPAGLPLVVQQELLESLGRPLDYEEIAAYRAVVLVPHVPNNAAFADLYALHVLRCPTRVPAGGALHLHVDVGQLGHVRRAHALLRGQHAHPEPRPREAPAQGPGVVAAGGRGQRERAVPPVRAPGGRLPLRAREPAAQGLLVPVLGLRGAAGAEALPQRRGAGGAAGGLLPRGGRRGQPRDARGARAARARGQALDGVCAGEPAGSSSS
ncbi:unnamed protein product [Prorocentrum cordatum]|uniref:Uncharacterized protein n=1 Tax=Prorocentrum cordatum TaxID=2364126 RepID=A0ABN9Y3P4_9DINO|nr:unnamed protein product [Polarella glacialis]